MSIFALKKDKALNSLLYVCSSQGGAVDMYNLLKIIFFADSNHLFNYGRPITGDTMYSMKYGPVPSFCYDLVKVSSDFFNVDQNIIANLVDPDVSFFSESDVECLDKSIRENAPLSFNDMKKKSHTRSYEKTKNEQGLDMPMSYIDIAKEDGHVSDEMLKYIVSRFEY